MTDLKKAKFIEFKGLFERWAGEPLLDMQPLPPSGSYREYFRLKGNSKTVVGVHNDDIEENIAFITFTKHFTQAGLHVPALYSCSGDRRTYIIEDLGDTTLHGYLQHHPPSDTENKKKVIELYHAVLDELIRFQLDGDKGLDYSVAYPRAAFDKQSIMWDLNYFKYYFIKLFRVRFHEQRLEDDFDRFSTYLTQTDCNHFLYRDFQSRNILIKERKLFFIDYQGGRKGALPYDLASLLLESKINLAQELKSELFEYYLTKLNERYTVNPTTFKTIYYAYALIRLMQAMGAYGFRGVIEKKKLFIESIPPAIKQLTWLLDKVEIMTELAEMKHAFNHLIQSTIIINHSKD